MRRAAHRALLSLLVVASALSLAGSGPPAAALGGPGYWLLAADGGVFAFGDAAFHGSTGGRRLNQPVVGMAAASSGAGYWLVAADGGVFTFGDVAFHGSTGDLRLNQPVVGMAEAPTGGYWLVAADGGIFSFGDARFSGSTGDIRLNSPIVAMAATPTGAGYWLAAADGGVFAFGDAPFFGSAAELGPPRPIVGMAAHPDGAGYWLVAADGSLYAFGSARASGTVANPGNLVGMAATAGGAGYWLVAADGAVTAFGDASQLGSVAGTLNRPVVGIAASRVAPEAESRQPGAYPEPADNLLGVTFEGGSITRASTAVVDCFCHQRLDFGIGLEGAAPSQRFVARLRNTSGVPMRLPGGLRVDVTGTGQPGTWGFTITEPSLTSLDPGVTATLSVPVPAQADGDYSVSARTVVVLD